VSGSTGGAQFEILVDGKSRSWRDTRETALEAAQYLKERTPNLAVAVRDVLANTTVQVLGVEKPPGSKLS
jgi:predicted Rdx family selenoprotein